ncbi:MAG: MFS transporter [Candidatus Helarchaeota archaeon]|nr:MFS transporter [Candidatus Helarchaeota archaeon]
MCLLNFRSEKRKLKHCNALIITDRINLERGSEERFYLYDIPVLSETRISYKITPSRRTHFFTLFFLVMLSWSLTVLLAPLVGEIATSFGLSSEAEIGNISAIFLLIGGSLSFIWVGIEDRLSNHIQSSRKLLLIIATIIWSFGLFLTSISQNYSQLFSFQMVTAVGYAAITPLAFSMAMDLTPPKDRAKAFGLLDIAAMIGAGLGFLLSGLTVGIIPWPIPFAVIASFGLVLTGFVIDIKDPKRGIQEEELCEVISEGSHYNFRIDRKNLSSMLKNRTNLLVIIFNTILYVASGSITYYFIRMMVNDHAFSSSMAVLFFLMIFSSQTIGAMFWSRRADRKFSRKPDGKVKVLIESLVIGPGFLVLAFSLVFTINNTLMVGLFTVFLVIGAFLISGLISISFSILSDCNPPEMRTTIFSLNNLAQTLGRAMGILTMGALFIFYGEAYQWGFAVVGGIYFLSILFTLPLISSVPIELSRLNALLQERARRIQRTLPL